MTEDRLMEHWKEQAAQMPPTRACGHCNGQGCAACSQTGTARCGCLNAEQRAAADLHIELTAIIATDIVIASVYEPTDWVGAQGARHPMHSTIQHIGGRWMGRVGTRHLPADLEALPAGSGERWTEVRRWQQSEYNRAYAALGAAGWDGRRNMGEMTLTGAQAAQARDWLREHGVAVR